MCNCINDMKETDPKKFNIKLLQQKASDLLNSKCYFLDLLDHCELSKEENDCFKKIVTLLTEQIKIYNKELGELIKEEYEN